MKTLEQNTAGYDQWVFFIFDEKGEWHFSPSYSSLGANEKEVYISFFFGCKNAVGLHKTIKIGLIEDNEKGHYETYWQADINFQKDEFTSTEYNFAFNKKTKRMFLVGDGNNRQECQKIDQVELPTLMERENTQVDVALIDRYLAEKLGLSQEYINKFTIMGKQSIQKTWGYALFVLNLRLKELWIEIIGIFKNDRK